MEQGRTIKIWKILGVKEDETEILQEIIEEACTVVWRGECATIIHGFS